MSGSNAGMKGDCIAECPIPCFLVQIFDEHMPGPNQLSVMREDVHVTAADLLQVPVVRTAHSNVKSMHRIRP